MPIAKDFSGNMRLDISPYRLGATDYMYAWNITRNAEADYGDGPVSNLVGNRIAAYTQPEGLNMCIGAVGDSLRNRIYSFHWNENGYHQIRMFDRPTRTIYRILESRGESGDVDILNLQLLYKVNDIYVIHREEEEGDLLLWNDAYNRPGQLNIKDFLDGIYGISVTDDLIRLARIPGLDELTPAYTDDNTQLVNNLKKKLFQFTYAWVYKNGEISTIAPISKVALPYLAGDVSTESDPGKNNVITLQVTGGPEDYKAIRIFARENKSDNIWGDWLIVDTLERDDYNIDPGGTYTYRFLNDGQYVSADQRYMDLLFDWIADKAESICLVNGNVVVQSGITAGYNPIKRSNINVQISAELVDTDSSDVDPSNPTITYASTSPFPFKRTDFTIGPSISEGCFYSIKFHVPVFDAEDYNPSATHIVGSGGTDADKIAAAAQDLATQLNSQMSPTSTRKAEYIAPNIIRVTTTTYAIDSIITDARSPVFFTGGSATMKYAAKYRLGLVYVSLYGKTNGVISFVSSVDDPTDFALTTPSFDFNPATGAPKVPVINASINHIPPDWAVAYYWVRTPNQTTDSFLQYVTAEVINDDVNYWYFCIENLNVFRAETTGFIPSYTFKPGDRLRVYASYDSDTETYVNYPVADYEILGTVQKDMTTLATEKTQGMYLKVKKPQGAAAFANNSFIEIYSPLLRTTDETTVFYAFGESYPIYTDGATGIKYHVGQIDNQTASQPATFQFRDGDVYYKFREIYKLDSATGKIDPTTVFPIGLMDANYSDYWNSAVNSNSRGWLIDPDAKRLTEPALMGHSQEYQPGTDINGINRFYPEDIVEASREHGFIKKIFAWNNVMIVCQQLKIGRCFVDQQITYNIDGTTQIILSSKLLSDVQYYDGQYGIGDFPESVAYNNSAIYGWTNKRGVNWRLSQNGLTPISITEEYNNFAVSETEKRGFGSKIYGVFDARNNLYLSAFEAAADSPAKTLVWNERKNGLETFAGFLPEMMCCLDNLLVAFKDGNLYTHDSAVFNNFFGEQQSSSIQVVFNESPLKKSYNTMTLISEEAWEVEEATTNVTAFSTPSVQKQKTVIKASQFKYDEGMWEAAFNQNINSQGGLNNGSPLKGSFMIVKFTNTNANTLLTLNSAILGIKESVKNP